MDLARTASAFATKVTMVKTAVARSARMPAVATVCARKVSVHAAMVSWARIARSMPVPTTVRARVCVMVLAANARRAGLASTAACDSIGCAPSRAAATAIASTRNANASRGGSLPTAVLKHARTSVCHVDTAPVATVNAIRSGANVTVPWRYA